MEGYDTATYGERIAGIYDEWYADCDPAMIETLARLAGDGPALELGIGTGRVALPLAERGVRVSGVDASESMVARLRARPGGEAVAVTLGDFSAALPAGEFDLVYVVFSTFYALIEQEAQVRCFRSAAERLAPGGHFVIEAFFPDLSRFVRGQNTQTVRVETDWVMLDAVKHDAVGQVISGQHVVIREDGVKLYPVKIRYAWPTELDLMARVAGLELAHRWGGWSGEPFTASSMKHVSVYRRE
jgi:SAM-dependent methyltransferase